MINTTKPTPSLSDQWKVLQYVFANAQVNSRAFWGNITLRVIHISLAMVLPLLTKELIDILDQGVPLSDIWSHVGPTLIKYALCLLFGKLIIKRVRGFVYSTHSKQVMNSLSKSSMQHILTQAHDFFIVAHHGSIQQLMKDGIGALGKCLDIFINHFLSVALTVGWVVMMVSYQSLKIGFVFVGLIVLTIVWQYYTFKKLNPHRKQSQIEARAQSGLLADILSNIFTIKIFATEQAELHTFDLASQKLHQAKHEVSLNLQKRGLGFDFFEVTFGIVSWGLGIYFFAQGEISLGVVVFLAQYSSRLIGSLFAIRDLLRDYFFYFNQIEDLMEITETPALLSSLNKKKILTPGGGHIQFQEVDFAYGEQASLYRKLSFEIQPGEKVGIVGSSGAGKSTLISLLFGFYPLNGGKILIDGQDIAEIDPQSLRSALAMVPQDPTLFHRSIRDNIAYAHPDASDEEVKQAAHLARCEQFILNMPQQYETLVGERGLKLSGGERQRIAIARAILAQREIFIMDEATSSLDSESEHYIQEALKEVMKGRTSIVIAHRLSTIMQMDRILVMDQGKIIEEGTHEELLAQKGYYYYLFSIQSWGFLGGIDGGNS